MRNRHLIAVTLLVGVTAALLSPTCTNPAGGTATETGNVSGVIYNAGGTPAAGATVRFYPVDYNPRNGSLGKVKVTAVVASKDSVTTDAYGRYSVTLDSGSYNLLASGSYNLLASGDTTLAFHDSLPARKGDTAHHTDTLRAPGSIQGVITMQGSDDPRTVFIIFIGTGNVYVPQDSLGNFLIRNLAQGSYHVRFLSTLDLYTVKDTSLSVTAGRVDTLAAPIQLTYTGIPVPEGLKIQYDTNMQVVTLVWNKPTTGSPVQGYEIYRKNAAYNTLPTAINSLIVTDTVYHDSTGVQDSGYTYYVAAVDTGNGGVGRMSGGVGVTIAGMYSFERAWGSFGSATGQMNGPQALAVNAQGLVYVADAGNNRIQIFDSMGQYNGEFGDSLLNQPWDIAIEDSFVYVATNGNQNIYEFTLSGTFLSKISLPSNTLFPQIGVDSNFNVYAVASANSGQILVYNKSGVQSQMLNISTSICGNVDLLGTTLFAYSTSDSLILARSLANGKQDTIPLGFGSVPIDIAGDSSHIFVLNRPTPNKGIVSTYNKELEFIGKWGGNISYIQVSSIAADLNGHIYILDEDNQKISQFRKAN